MKSSHPLAPRIWSLLAMSMLLPAAAAPLPFPARGFVSSQPAKIWEEGLLCGNGTIGINVLSRPLNERTNFTHVRLFMPNPFGESSNDPGGGARRDRLRHGGGQGRKGSEKQGRPRMHAEGPSRCGCDRQGQLHAIDDPTGRVSARERPTAAGDEAVALAKGWAVALPRV